MSTRNGIKNQKLIETICIIELCPKSVNYNTTSQWSQHTCLLRRKVSNLNKINESLHWFGDWKWAYRNRIKNQKLKEIHLHHRDMSKSVKYNTTSQWCKYTCLPKRKLSNLNKINESLEWYGDLNEHPETESKPEIERNHLHHRVMSISVELQHYFPMIPTYTSPKHKVSNLNIINESREWFWDRNVHPETESKPEIERNHLHHRDSTNSVIYNTTSQWSHYTRLIRTKCPIWIK